RSLNLQSNQTASVATSVTCLASWTTFCCESDTTRLTIFQMRKLQSDSRRKRVQTRAYCATVKKMPNGRVSNCPVGSHCARTPREDNLLNTCTKTKRS